MCPRPRRKAPYRSVTGWGSLLHGRRRPPLSRCDVLPQLRWLLGKGRPGVVGLVQGAVRPTWCPAGCLAVSGVGSRSCYRKQHKHTRVSVIVLRFVRQISDTQPRPNSGDLVAPTTLHSGAQAWNEHSIYKYLHCLLIHWKNRPVSFVFKSLSVQIEFKVFCLLFIYSCCCLKWSYLNYILENLNIKLIIFWETDYFCDFGVTFRTKNKQIM